MRKALCTALVGACLMLPCAGSVAGMAGQREAVSRLGELNGIALQCRYLDQVRRMKQAVIGAAPQEREFGADFDAATNRAFLAFIDKGARCPGRATFEARVGTRIEELNASFAPED